MIDKVDASVTSLEEAAYKLDTYSKELGMINSPTVVFDCLTI